jgi:hypothetical protein
LGFSGWRLKDFRVGFLTHNETGSKGFWATVTGSLNGLTQKPNPLPHLDFFFFFNLKKKGKENDLGWVSNFGSPSIYKA